MEMQEKIALTATNIEQALKDYVAHTDSHEVVEDVSSAFINRLASDSVRAKQGLREMFRKSPVWNEELDALVINGTRTHNPNYSRADSLAREILYDAARNMSGDERYLLENAIEFFTCPDVSEHTRSNFIKALNKLAPNAYAPKKKPSRIFKALCQALNVADETAGSNFQKLYAQFADEISSKQIPFKLFVSLNPAHFLTMSNPKHDNRGDTLTSCHSFNSLEYDYNCGCVGYARDDVTMIAFTVSDPDNPETLNNRKTTRQLYMYRPNSGLLLQSRMYNTCGGTQGAQEESKIYRDLIQREISECEDAINLWKTFKYVDNRHGINFEKGAGFGGYPDWMYSDFAAMVSLRNDYSDEPGFDIGSNSLCVMCGTEIYDNKLHCSHCFEEERKHLEECLECGQYVSIEDIRIAYDRHGETRVCQDCLDECYTYCECCGNYYHNDLMVETGADEYMCVDCRNELCVQCDCCGEWWAREDVQDGLCHDCREEHCARCEICGDWWDEGCIQNGLCPACREKGGNVECTEGEAV